MISQKNKTFPLVLDFAIYELLLITRLPLKVRQFEKLLISLIVVLFFAVLSATIFVSSIFESNFTEIEFNIPVLATMFSLALTLGALYSDLVGTRKNIIPRFSNRNFFRALNFSPADVHIVYIVTWRLPLHITLFAFCLGIFFTTQKNLENIVFAFTPLALFIFHYATTKLAIFCSSYRSRTSIVDIFLATVAITLGTLFGLAIIIQADQISKNIPLLDIGYPTSAIIIWINVILYLSTLGTYLILRIKMRREGHWVGFEYEQSEINISGMKKVTIAKAISQGWLIDPQRLSAAKVRVFLLFITAFFTVIHLSGEYSIEKNFIVNGILLSLAIFAALGFSDSFLIKHGLSAQLCSARTVWEIGFSAKSIIIAHNYHIIGYSLFWGILVGILAFPIAGMHFAIYIFILPFGASAGRILADTLIPSITNTDGSLTVSSLTPLFSFLLTLPLFGTLMVNLQVAIVIVTLYTIILWGGVVICQNYSIRKRISNLIA